MGGWLGCTRTGKLCVGMHHSFTETYLHRKVCLYLRNSISPLVEFLSFLYSFKVSFLNEETRGAQHCTPMGIELVAGGGDGGGGGGGGGREFPGRQRVDWQHWGLWSQEDLSPSYPNQQL